jgi:hypothetical protein
LKLASIAASRVVAAVVLVQEFIVQLVAVFVNVEVIVIVIVIVVVVKSWGLALRI